MAQTSLCTGRFDKTQLGLHKSQTNLNVNMHKGIEKTIWFWTTKEETKYGRNLGSQADRL